MAEDHRGWLERIDEHNQAVLDNESERNRLPLVVPDLPCRFGSRLANIVNGSVCLASALATLGESFANAGPHEPSSIAARAFGIIAFLVMAAAAVRLFRVALLATSEGLVVRNVTHSCRIAWREVASFELPVPNGMLVGLGLQIKLTDGKVVKATAVNIGRYRVGLRARRDRDSLRALRLASLTKGPE